MKPREDPFFVLVPGAGGSAYYWHRVVAALAERRLDSVAVELPAADPDAGLAAYGDAIRAAVGDHRDVVLVGQSMGGLSVPLVADRARQIVLVNAMVPLPGESGGEWWAATGQAEARREHQVADGRPVAEFDPFEDFFHDLPDDVRDDLLSRPEPEQSERPFADAWPLPAWPDVPTRVLAGRDDRFFPAEFQRHIAHERLGLDADVIPGGHLIALSNPEGVVTKLVEYAG